MKSNKMYRMANAVKAVPVQDLRRLYAAACFTAVIIMVLFSMMAAPAWSQYRGPKSVADLAEKL